MKIVDQLADSRLAGRQQMERSRIGGEVPHQQKKQCFPMLFQALSQTVYSSYYQILLSFQSSYFSFLFGAIKLLFILREQFFYNLFISHTRNFLKLAISLLLASNIFEWLHIPREYCTPYKPKCWVPKWNLESCMIGFNALNYIYIFSLILMSFESYMKYREY